MEFLQKHYEKILLSLVLAGLAVAAAWLPVKVSALRDDMDRVTQIFTVVNPKPLPPLEMKAGQDALQRLKKPPKLDLAKTGHNVFNPIKWMKKADGSPVPSLEAVVLHVTAINPLHLRIEYKGVSEAGESLRYQFQITREAATNVAGQRPFIRVAALGNKNEVFTLKEIRGPKEDPTAVGLELLEYKTNVWVAKDEPFKLVAGYSADLRCESESRSFVKQRSGQKITLSGATYNIVAISQHDVTLEDSQTKKRTTIEWRGAP